MLEDRGKPQGAIPPTGVNITRHKTWSDSCCIRFVYNLLLAVTSLSIIAGHTTFYTLYFHIWNSTLMDFDQTHPGLVDLSFLNQVIWILIPVEMWLLTSAVGIVVFGVELILRKMGFFSRQSLVVAISTFTASIVFGVVHFGVYNFHQFTIMKILSYQLDYNTTFHLYQQVTSKLWDLEPAGATSLLDNDKL